VTAGVSGFDFRLEQGVFLIAEAPSLAVEHTQLTKHNVWGYFCWDKVYRVEGAFSQFVFRIQETMESYVH
jgi:hypothetical protein